MSEAENPARSGADHTVTVDDVRRLMGASTPHFALQLRGRIARLIQDLAPDHPARKLGEQEIARLTALGLSGEVRGTPHEPEIRPLPSVDEHAAAAAHADGGH
ncbi:MAG: hypothetical protein JWO02_787 [Solirubrobacterales bacterium]|nr:hypothetical protein [Solirubrobacterales bacterium]